MQFVARLNHCVRGSSEIGFVSDGRHVQRWLWASIVICCFRIIVIVFDLGFERHRLFGHPLVQLEPRFWRQLIVHVLPLNIAKHVQRLALVLVQLVSGNVGEVVWLLSLCHILAAACRCRRSAAAAAA